MTPEQAELIDRLRALLTAEPSTREVPMFGGLSFMLNDKLIVSALRGGDLLVRVAPERDSELGDPPGASPTEMGARPDHGTGLDLGLSGGDNRRRPACLLAWRDPGAQLGHGQGGSVTSFVR